MCKAKYVLKKTHPNVIGMSKYGNSAPGPDPQKTNFSEIFDFYGKVSEFYF